MTNILQIIFSGLVALSTVVYAVLTWRLVNETRKIRQAQITPDIVVYFEKSETDASFVYIIIENQGQGRAREVKFEILHDFIIYDSEELRLNKGVFKYGVKNFYSQQKFRYLFTDLSKKYDEKLKSNLELLVKYSDILGNNYENIVNLSLDEFSSQGLIYPPDSFLGKIPYELQKIRETLKKRS